MTKQLLLLKYRFRGFIFEFMGDHIIIKDVAFGRVFKLEFNGAEFTPFNLTLVEQGRDFRDE